MTKIAACMEHPWVTLQRAVEARLKGEGYCPAFAMVEKEQYDKAMEIMYGTENNREVR